MPPSCFVCDRDGGDLPDNADLWTYFALVQFALDRAEQLEQDARNADGVTGHPLGAVWFCREHVGLAQPRAEMHWRTALEQIRAVTDTGPAAGTRSGA
jgi:hypothetical protein